MNQATTQRRTPRRPLHNCGLSCTAVNGALLLASMILPGGTALADGSAEPVVLYQQEAVRDLRQRVQIYYMAETLAKYPALRNGFIDAAANANYAEFNVGRTHFAMFGQLTNPAADVLTLSLEPLTGLAIPPGGDAARQLGVNGGPEKGINALQTSGSALGACLAPRALTDRPFIHGVFAVYNWAHPVATFEGSVKDRIRVEGYFRHPYVSVKPVGNHTIPQEGAVFFYYTLQFRDMTQDRDLWFVVRLYQDKFARPSDPWTTLMDRDALSVDGTNPATSIGLIDAILRPDSERITPVAGTSHFSQTPFSGERYFAFELSAGQFQRALQSLNKARVAHATYSEKPSDYRLRHYNVNIESWAPSPACDPRIGLSWRDIRITAIRDPATPAGHSAKETDGERR